MRFYFAQPSGFLNTFVKDYCFMESDPGERDVQERVVPTESIQLMFHYGNPFVFCHEDHSVTRQPQSVISGLAHSFLDVSTCGAAGVAFVRFFSAGACHFFRFPLYEIENGSFNLCDVWNGAVRELEDCLCEALSVSARVQALDSFLLTHFSPISAFDAALVRAGVDCIRKNRGQISSRDLSRELAVTSKTLERKFAAYVGKTPKQFSKVIRFQQTIADLTSRGDRLLTDQAFENGYCDQSHFIKDFKAFSGYTPREFLVRYPECNTDMDSSL